MIRIGSREPAPVFEQLFYCGNDDASRGKLMRSLRCNECRGSRSLSCLESRLNINPFLQPLGLLDDESRSSDTVLDWRDLHMQAQVE
jgi:hypothetical protein